MRFTLFFVAVAAVFITSCETLRDEARWQPLLQSNASCGGFDRSDSGSGSVPATAQARRTRAAKAAARGPECKMGTDGRQACGYHCQMGSDGVVACANTADGTCAIGTNGRVVCSQVVPAVGPKPECHRGSRGENTCGYNCRFGSNGRWYCASTPDGVCAFNSNGTWTCS